ncbi:hypothetical protein KCP69_13975 [Salmonella enterica subsp. enterica]|nr:hypothetical protein KCP69_13975 [Salmonella enterica subsp. enterica]
MQYESGLFQTVTAISIRWKRPHDIPVRARIAGQRHQAAGITILYPGGKSGR